MRPTILSILALVFALGVWTAQAGEIHDAIDAEDAGRVQALLKKDPGVAHSANNDQFHYLPLHTAAVAGNVEIARLLLDAGAVVDGFDSDESTPLDVAALIGQRDMVAFLLERGADVNRRDRNGSYPLSFAVSGGDTAVVRMILEAGADLNYRSINGLELLHMAASRGLSDLVDRLIARGDDVNAFTDYAQTPLHWAASRGHVQIMKALVDAGAEIAVVDSGGETPFFLAVSREQPEAARFFLDRGAEVNVTNRWGSTPLYAACRRGNADVVRALIAHGAEANTATEDGATPIQEAVWNGHAEILPDLVRAGADTKIAEGHHGWSLLHIAALCGHTDVVQELVRLDAPLNGKDGAGRTPLDVAANHGQKQIVSFLASQGATGAGIDVSQAALSAQQDLSEGEAVIWHLGHSGWAIQTENNLLIFDYFTGQERNPDEPCLSNGRIDPAEIAGEKVTVFASHGHGDHFDPAVFEWREALDDVTYVLGWPEQGENVPAYELIEGRQTKKINGMKVKSIEANDTGVGFVVEVDGLVIFHAGDHANRQQDFSGPFKAEVDYLASSGCRPDIAFMPIRGCGFGDQVAVKMGVHYALETLKPLVFLPMHSGRGTHNYQAFIDECREQFPDTHMEAVEAKGDRYRYSQGKTS